MLDPLNPGAVRPTDQTDDALPQDNPRPWWTRLLTSLRPSVGVEVDKKTGKKIEDVSVTGHLDF